MPLQPRKQIVQLLVEKSQLALVRNAFSRLNDLTLYCAWKVRRNGYQKTQTSSESGALLREGHFLNAVISPETVLALNDGKRWVRTDTDRLANY